MLVLNQKNLPQHKKGVSKLARKVIALYAMKLLQEMQFAITKKLNGFDMDPSYISKSTKQLWSKIEESKTRRLDKSIP